MNVTTTLVKSFFCAVLLLMFATASRLHAKEPDIFFYANPKAIQEMSFVKQTTSLPEWEPFWSLFCAESDKGIRKELTHREQLAKVLPSKLVDVIAQGTTSGISFRDAVQKVSEHLEAVVFMAEANDMQGFDGVVALIGDVNPAPVLVWLPMLGGIEEGTDYIILKQEPNGEFIIKVFFRFPARNINIEFCCAGLKLPGQTSRYALLFSNEEHIRKYFSDFKEGRTTEEYAKGFAQRIVVREPCFRFLEELGKQHTSVAQAADIFGKIKSIEFSLGDKDRASQVEVRLSLGQAEDVKTIHDLLGGFLALVQLSPNVSPEAIRVLQSIRVESEKNDMLITMKLDHPELLKLISDALNKISNGIRKKNE